MIIDCFLKCTQFIGLDKQTKNESKKVNIFLFISFNIYFGYSKEPSYQEGSFEYPKHMFWLRNKKINYELHTLILRPSEHINLLFNIFE